MEEVEERKLIKLSLINGRVMTFDHEDYMTLRRKFRIIGKLIGVPVIYPRNLQWRGLPAVFNDFEVKLMLEKNFVIVEDKNLLKSPPSDEIKENYVNYCQNFDQETSSSDYQEKFIEKRLELTRLKMKHILKGKRQKLLKSGVPEEEITITEDDILKEETERIRQTFVDYSCNTQIQIPTKFPFPSNITTTTVPDIPVNDMRKYEIFRDLWEKNFYITNGDIFGCDFLVYVGEPMSFHASQLVHVIDKSQKFSVKFMISCARLSVSVNKKCTFAYVRPNGEVVYQNLEWDNPKVRDTQQPSTSSLKQCSLMEDMDI